jgi:hypothetical protein
MPPAAISRSSTYFPKICGNIPTEEGSLLVAVLLGAILGSGCGSKEAVVTQVPLRANDLVSCPIEPRADFDLRLSALGDFRPGVEDSAELALDADAIIEFSPETRGLEAVSRDPGERTFQGYTERRSDAGIDVLLWPDDRACLLRDPDTARSYPGIGGGQALGFAPELGVAFVAGEDTGATLAGGAQSALRFDANTGVVELQPAMQPMPTHRAHATVTPFGDGFLVAGGENPTSGDAFGDRARWNSAHSYALSLGVFAAETIALQWDRTRHAALRLADGSTLLAGGIAEGGPVLQFEAIYPASSASSTIGLAALSVGRLEPALLALTDGRLLVGGGYLPIGSPVGTLEWFSPDASERLTEFQLPPRAHRVFAALPGGGVLTVACAGPSRRDEPCLDGLEATWLSGDSPPTVTPVAIAESAGCDPTATPLLVPGSEGAPWLITVSDATTPACVRRFKAWPLDYAPPPDTAQADWPLPDSLPRFEAREKLLDPPPDPRILPLSLGPDSFVWVTRAPGGGLAGARFGRRGSLTHYPFPLVGSSVPAEGRYYPPELAPDRPVPVDPSSAVSVPHLFATDPSASGAFESLTLTPPALGEPALTVWITDTLYEDVTLTLSLSSRDESELGPAAPALRFGSSLVGSAGNCAWPPPAADEFGNATVSAVRRGTRVTLRASSSIECEVAAGPLAIGLRAPGDGGCEEGATNPCSSRVTELGVQRD